jgi:hypothetical protein
MNRETEELVDEASFRALPRSRQRDLIARHYDGILEQAKNAASNVEAREIVRRACVAFESDCSSPLIRRALVRHVMSVFEEQRGTR